jgi:hypothetical protein
MLAFCGHLHPTLPTGAYFYTFRYEPCDAVHVSSSLKSDDVVLDVGTLGTQWPGPVLAFRRRRSFVAADPGGCPGTPQSLDPAPAFASGDVAGEGAARERAPMTSSTWITPFPRHAPVSVVFDWRSRMQTTAM